MLRERVTCKAWEGTRETARLLLRASAWWGAVLNRCAWHARRPLPPCRNSVLSLATCEVVLVPAALLKALLPPDTLAGLAASMAAAMRAQQNTHSSADDKVSETAAAARCAAHVMRTLLPCSCLHLGTDTTGLTLCTHGWRFEP